MTAVTMTHKQRLLAVIERQLVLIVALVGALIFLRRLGGTIQAKRA